MKSIRQRFWTSITMIGFCTFIVLCGIQSLEGKRHSTLRYLGGEHMRQLRPKLTPAQEEAYTKRQRAFFQIWTERQQRDISVPLLPFLKDEEPQLREQTVRALGRIESKIALPKLLALKSRMETVRKQENIASAQWNKINPVADFTLNLAIARIQSKGKTGQSKLDALLNGVGLKWRDVPPITRRAWYVSDGRHAPPQTRATPQEKALLREILDVFYDFKARGQDISKWTKQLNLAPAEQVWLSTASMPRKQALSTLVKYISSLQVAREQDYTLTRSICLSLGADCVDMMRQKLNYLSAHPNPQGKRKGTVMLIRAVSYIGDQKSLPVLKKFANDKDSRIRSESRRAITHIQQKDFFVLSPM